jgi:hypothetical protein
MPIPADGTLPTSIVDPTAVSDTMEVDVALGGAARRRRWRKTRISSTASTTSAMNTTSKRMDQPSMAVAPECAQ